MRQFLLTVWLAFAPLCLMATFADAATVRASSGATAAVSARMAPAARCLIDGLESAGVKIKFMGGYGKRKFRHSKHPAGNAIDVNQYRRNVTSPQIPRALGIQVAHRCGLISGGAWHNADNGHFEIDGGGGLGTRYAAAPTHDRNSVW